MKLDVISCPFCAGDSVDEVSKVEHVSDPTHESTLTVYTYCCPDCGGFFTVKDCGDDSGTCATVKKCTDDKEECKCAAPAAEWYERRYYETLRELEKTRYLLDLTIKEGMRRE